MKKCWKQVLLLVMVTVAAICIGRTETKAATIVKTGSCGDSATYTLDSDGVLTISGSGEIEGHFSYDFYGEGIIKKVIIQNDITGIGYSAFYSCSSLNSITIPDSVTSIGMRAFCGCSSLASITIPNNVSYIGKEAFYGCSGLTSIIIPDSVTSIETYAFYGCSSLKSITIPDSAISIEKYAFYGCDGLISVIIPNSITSIGLEAFGYRYDEELKWTAKIDGVIIYGIQGSTAETYAKENGFTFKTIAGKTKLTSKNTTVKLSKTSFNFDGKAKKPTVKVLDTKGRTLKKSYYTVTYSNNVKVGKATATITFKGKYSGTIKKTFTIKPAKTTITGTSRKSDSVTLTWKKQKKEASGYQIQYATDRKFTKNAKTVISAGMKKSSKKISGLSKKTTYYFRIRTYKTVNGKKYYSGWSKVETVKTK